MPAGCRAGRGQGQDLSAIFKVTSGVAFQIPAGHLALEEVAAGWGQPGLEPHFACIRCLTLVKFLSLSEPRDSHL